MKKIKLLTGIFLSLLLLNSCSTVAEGLTGGKKKDGTTISTEENDLSIEDMLSQSSSIDKTKKKSDLNNSIENSIIEKINE